MVKAVSRDEGMLDRGLVGWDRRVVGLRDERRPEPCRVGCPARRGARVTRTYQVI
jgi:hypothetical protein